MAPHDCQGLRFHDATDLYEPPKNAGVGGVGKNGVFRPVEKSPTQTPYRRKFVSIRHGCLHPRRCAGGGICSIVDSSVGSRV